MMINERAAGVVQEFYSRRTWGYDPNQHAEFVGLIADAIRAAVETEREACAKAAEDSASLHLPGEEVNLSTAARFRARQIANAIRARGVS